MYLPKQGSRRLTFRAVMARVLVIVVSTLVLVAALFVSLFLFAIVLIAGIGFGGWAWWQLRSARKRAELRTIDGQSREVEPQEERPPAP